MIPTAARSQEAAPPFPPLGKKIKALLVWPKIPNSFWAFNGMLELLPEKVLMPPLGLVTVAALCPSEWTLRLVDEAVEDLTDDHLRWADLVMVGGMEVQKAGMEEILTRARALGRRTMAGGPYASSEQERMLALADHVVVLSAFRWRSDFLPSGCRRRGEGLFRRRARRHGRLPFRISAQYRDRRH